MVTVFHSHALSAPLGPDATASGRAHESVLARTGRIAALTVRGAAIFAVTGLKVAILGKDGVD
ncbi:MAG: hypothetical protein HOV66_17440 [Streptomycetaceae bacterium]|nr:hypothetical protein [Streptomycetaceae bacterium]NUS56617.1 hypothetical protein [Streptomycetaceae bacterium]